MNNFRQNYGEFCSYLNDNFSDIDIIQMKYRLQKAMYYKSSLGWALPPHTINLGVNNRCNFKCKMCDFGQENKDTFYYKFNIGEKKGTKELEIDKCIRLVSETEWFKPIIRVDYLEPTLWKPLRTFFRFVKSRNLRFWLLSNGYSMKDDFIEELVDRDLNVMRFSLNGTEDIHNDICGRKNAFERVLNTIDRFIYHKGKYTNKSKTPDIGVYFTLQDTNYEYMYDMIEYLSKNRILDHIFVNFQWLLYTTEKQAELHNKKHGDITTKIEDQCLSAVDLSKIDIDKIDEQVKKIKKRFRNQRIFFRPTFDKQILKQYLRTDSPVIPSARCYIPWYSCAVAPSGDVNFFQHCFLKSIGNINQDNFNNIWNSQEAKEQRMQLQSYKSYIGCQRCWGVYNLLDQKRRYK